MPRNSRQSFPTIPINPQPQATQQNQRTLPRTIPTGTMRGNQSLGENNIQIDNPNSRITINDGTNDRVLIGKQVGGF